MKIIPLHRNLSRQFIVAIGYIAAVIFLISCTGGAFETSYAIAIRGSIVISLSLLPGAIYLSSQDRSSLPLMPMNSLFYTIAFGMPAFSQASDRRLVVHDIIRESSLETTIYALLAQIISYYTTFALLPWSRIQFFAGGISSTQVRQMAWTLIACKIIGIAIPSLGTIPTVGQFSSLAGIIGTALIYGLYLIRKLSPVECLIFFAMFIPVELALRISTGSIANAMLLCLLLITVKWAVASRVDWVILFVLLITFILFAPHKQEYRRITWSNERGELSSIEKFVIYIEIVSNSWQSERTPLPEAEANAIAQRFNQLVILDIVHAYTPELVPYWNGKTLESGWTVFIPRLIWNDKPTQTIGNEFGHRYFLLDSEDQTTSINLPWLIELYANFGDSGVIIGFCIFGGLFAAIDRTFGKPNSHLLNRLLPLGLTLNLGYPESNIIVLWGGLVLGSLGLYLATRFIAELRL